MNKVVLMRTVRILFLLFMVLSTADDFNVYAQKKVVGYYVYWYRWSYPADKIDYQNLTHINHSFITPEKDGSLLIPSDLIYPELIKNAHNAGVKVLISVGGADTAVAGAFTEMSSNPELRTKFVDNLFDFVIKNNYDGVDIDWEFPSDEIEKNVLTILIKELRDKFNIVNKIMQLSVAVTPNDFYGKYFDFENFIEYTDWVNLMAYNFHGSWSTHSGHNAPLFKNPKDPDNSGSVDEGFNYLNVVRNVPEDKIVLGIAFYGKEFNASGLFASNSGTVTDIIYSDIQPTFENPEWDYLWDEVSKVPYLLNKQKTKFVTFDDTTSIMLKCGYAKSKNLAGIMIWALGYDFINGESQLLKTIGLSLGLTTSVEFANYKNKIPSEYKLYDNYPNPFNPSTVIRFSLPRGSHVKLIVYDMLGREVEVLYDRYFDSGVYEATLSAGHAEKGRNMASGVYFYTLAADQFLQTKKMLLIK